MKQKITIDDLLSLKTFVLKDSITGHLITIAIENDKKTLCIGCESISYKPMRVIDSDDVDSHCDYNWLMVENALKHSAKNSDIYIKANEINKYGL